MRYLVQRRVSGSHSWWSLTGDDDPSIARSLCDQRANRGKRGDHFRVVDVHAGGLVVFEVLNPN